MISNQLTVIRKRRTKVLVSYFLLITILLITGSAEAQQPKKVPRIGFLGAASASSYAVRIDAFRQGLNEFGYIEGKNIVIEYRYAEGKPDRLPALVAELVRLKVEIIVTTGGAVTRAAKQATSAIPIVMTNDPDPVANQFVASLSRPGGNITGLSTLAPELSGKRLEIIREVVPTLSRVAVLGTSTTAAYARMIRELEPVAKTLRCSFKT